MIEAGTNQEGLYWRYEMWLRATESALAAGLYDHLRHGTPAGWEAPEGTR